MQRKTRNGTVAAVAPGTNHVARLSPVPKNLKAPPILVVEASIGMWCRKWRSLLSKACLRLACIGRRSRSIARRRADKLLRARRTDRTAQQGSLGLVRAFGACPDRALMSCRVSLLAKRLLFGKSCQMYSAGTRHDDQGQTTDLQGLQLQRPQYRHPAAWALHQVSRESGR